MEHRITFKYTKVHISCVLSVCLLVVISISTIAQVPRLSQNSNFYISKTSDNHLYISSMDGLNVYDGHRVKVYRPSEECDMYGSNIQSYFFEDNRGMVWFSTYEALHYHDVSTDSIHHFFLQQHDGVEAQEDYRCIALIGDDLIVKADRTLYIYNTADQRVSWSDTLGLKDGFMEKLWQIDDSYILTSSTNRLPVTRVIEFSQTWEVMRDTVLPVVSNSTLMYDHRLYVGATSGDLYIYSWPTLDLLDTYSITNSSIIGLANNLDGSVITLCADGTSTAVSNKGTLSPLDLSIDPAYAGRPLDPPFVDAEGILWYGIEGVGVQSLCLKANKFDQYGLKDAFYANTIISIADKFLVTSRVDGLMVLDTNFDILYHERSLLGDSAGFQSQYIGCVEDKVFIRVGEVIYSMSMDDFSMVKYPDLYANILLYEENNQGSFLVRRDISGLLFVPVASMDPDTIMIIENDILINSLKVLNDSIIFLGLNDVGAEVYELVNQDSAVLRKSLDIEGTIKCVTQASDSIILYCTDRGVYLLDTSYNLLGALEDKKGLLRGTVYAILIDDHGLYWCSTNSGIIKYDPVDSSAYQFDLTDGLQGIEYNTGSYFQLEDGRMIFGGVNGLNIFHPDSIRLSDYQTEVTISEFEVMDQPSVAFGQPNHIERIALPYDQNYFDFTFVGTDYSALAEVQLRYMLGGFDHHWQHASNPHTAEYKKVPPGRYLMRVNASNGDGVWSAHERVIPIQIFPPWWETWWFRTLATICLGAVIYAFVRYYLHQELRAKNLQLKAKQLELNKIEALAAERSRIASEMHDDIGGGLSSIRYLSQGMLMKIEDEATKVQVTKIFRYSQDLISNMGEIIWAMNSRFDSSNNFVAYTRRFASEFLQDFDIELDFSSSADVQGIHMAGGHRRNLFLIIKEALHNTVKHAQATRVCIDVVRQAGSMVLSISDDGKGYTHDQNQMGSGLANMKERAIAAGAVLVISCDQGTTIKIIYNIQGEY